MNDAPAAGRRATELALLVVGFALLAVYVARTIWDIDLFWHIAAGRAFVAAGSIPTTDIFSAIDPERTWVTFQWGYEVLVYLLDEAGGLPLIRVVHALVMWAAFAVAWFGLRRRLGWSAWASLAGTALLLVLFEDRIRVRPHVFNLLAWAILFPWLVRGPRSLDRRAVIATLLVVGVWANLHAGGAFLFLVAAATLPAGAIGARLLRLPAGDGGEPGDLGRALRWYAAALIPALLAPNFVRGNVQALTMLEGTEQAIGEWLPSWNFLAIAPSSGAAGPAHLICGAAPMVLTAAWLITAGLAAARGREGLSRGRPWALLFALAMVVLSQRSVRFAYAALFGFAALWPSLEALWPRLRARPRWLPVALAVVTLALGVVSYRFNVTAQHGDLSTALERAFGDEHIDARRFPTEQAAFLQATGFEGRVFSQANWGGYLLWKLWPRVLVIADGRGNYPRAVADDLAFVYDRGHHAPGAAVAAVAQVYERYPIDAVVHQHPVWPQGQQPPRSDWVRVFADRKGEVWIRNTARGRAYLQRLRALGEATAPPAPRAPRLRAP